MKNAGYTILIAVIGIISISILSFQFYAVYQCGFKKTLLYGGRVGIAYLADECSK